MIFSAGFPRKELSRVNQGRRGLRAGETARFEEAKILYKSLLENQTTTDSELMAVWECMQSMTIGSANTITKELRELDERIEVTGIGATGTSWCRRPRLWRTSFRVAKMEEEHEDRRHGIRHLHVHDELEPPENILEGDYAPRWIGQSVRRLHTFTRCRPATQEPSMQTGQATASPGELSRWASDAWRYSPYKYEGLACVVSEGSRARVAMPHGQRAHPHVALPSQLLRQREPHRG